jgi:hypothetical protein
LLLTREIFVNLLNIFPLGCCGHGFYDHNNFPLCFSNKVWSQSSCSSTCQALTYWKRCESNSCYPDSTWNDMSFFSWEHVFQKFLTWLITYFQLSCSSLMESNSPLQQKVTPYFSGFPLGCCDLCNTDCKRLLPSNGG